ncbi:MAG: glutaminyl-peptide cyclotransferase [Actinobacteria bacterium]|nr:glutaminyl-peptide cyclotransferase [Actinomycetota bacterium]
MTARRWGRTTALVLGMSLVAAGCGGPDRGRGDGPSAAATRQATVPPGCGSARMPTRLVPDVLDERPHDPTAFTEGLVVLDGVLYESTGLEGASSVRAVDPTTGSVLRQLPLDPTSFGEGLTDVGDDRLVQLTWKEGLAIVWDRSTLHRRGEHRYRGEGWGITTLDDGRLVMSDGSSTLTIRDPADFSILDRWTVTRADGPVDQLNELDWDGTHLWANRWQTDEIVRIDLRCHRVDAVVDASVLRQRAAAVATAPIDVLNGIAHEPGSDRFLVTGKDWPRMFEVRFVAAGSGSTTSR